MGSYQPRALLQEGIDLIPIRLGIVLLLDTSFQLFPDLVQAAVFPQTRLLSLGGILLGRLLAPSLGFLRQVHSFVRFCQLAGDLNGVEIVLLQQRPQRFHVLHKVGGVHAGEGYMAVLQDSCAQGSQMAQLSHPVQNLFQDFLALLRAVGVKKTYAVVAVHQGFQHATGTAPGSPLFQQPEHSKVGIQVQPPAHGSKGPIQLVQNPFDTGVLLLDRLQGDADILLRSGIQIQYRRRLLDSGRFPSCQSPAEGGGAILAKHLPHLAHHMEGDPVLGENERKPAQPLQQQRGKRDPCGLGEGKGLFLGPLAHHRQQGTGGPLLFRHIPRHPLVKGGGRHGMGDSSLPQVLLHVQVQAYRQAPAKGEDLPAGGGIVHPCSLQKRVRIPLGKRPQQILVQHIVPDAGAVQLGPLQLFPSSQNPQGVGQPGNQTGRSSQPPIALQRIPHPGKLVDQLFVGVQKDYKGLLLFF